MLSVKSELINHLASIDEPIIMYGCGFIGRMAAEVLSENGINITAFCDDNKELDNTDINGVEVLHTPAAQNKYSNAVYIVTPFSVYKVLRYFISNDIKKWYYAGVLLQGVDVEQNDKESYIVDLKKRRIKNCIDCHTALAVDDSLVLTNINVLVTECCTLKCKDCSNFMPYYKNPKHTSFETVQNSMGEVLNYVDQITLVTFMGGEAWLNPEWAEMLQYLVDSDKIKEVTIVTNGTLLPAENDISVLQNEKVIVAISNYGKLSSKIDELKELLVNNKIWHYEILQDVWYKGHEIKKRNRTYEENCKLFSSCIHANCTIIYDSKIFICPHIAHTLRLGLNLNCNNDYLDINSFSKSKFTYDDIRNMIRSYYTDTKVIDSCDYCIPFNSESERVEPAIQL